jgi:hypothetical protein
MQKQETTGQSNIQRKVLYNTLITGLASHKGDFIYFPFMQGTILGSVA